MFLTVHRELFFEISLPSGIPYARSTLHFSEPDIKHWILDAWNRLTFATWDKTVARATLGWKKNGRLRDRICDRLRHVIVKNTKQKSKEITANARVVRVALVSTLQNKKTLHCNASDAVQFNILVPSKISQKSASRACSIRISAPCICLLNFWRPNVTSVFVNGSFTRRGWYR